MLVKRGRNFCIIIKIPNPNPTMKRGMSIYPNIIVNSVVGINLTHNLTTIARGIEWYA